MKHLKLYNFLFIVSGFAIGGAIMVAFGHGFWSQAAHFSTLCFGAGMAWVIRSVLAKADAETAETEIEMLGLRLARLRLDQRPSPLIDANVKDMTRASTAPSNPPAA